MSNPDRQIAAFDELRDDEAKSVFRATHIEDRHDIGMVQFGEDTGFNEKRFHILGVGDSFGVWHLDGDRAVELIVVSKIDPSEPALTQPSEDRVTPDLRGVFTRQDCRIRKRKLASLRQTQALCLIRGCTRTLDGGCDPSV